MDSISDELLVALAGFAGGIVLGLAARIGRFCTLGAIEDAVYGGDMARARMWGVALGTAILGTFALEAAGFLDLTASLYLTRGWHPLAAVGGGLAFGYGMALTGACGLSALARAGGGDMRGVVIVLVLGISAYMAIGGPTAALREALFPTGPATDPAAQGLAHASARALGVPAWLPAGLAGAAFLGAALMGAGLGRARALWAAAVGLAIVSGWGATAWLARETFAAVPLESHTFATPIGEALIYAMTSTGASLSFGIGSVAGVIVGALGASLARREFRWEGCDDGRELRRQMVGAFLMGTGGVVALGCSVGQGLTAFSVLAVSAPVVVVSIVAGARLGLFQLLEVGMSRR